MTTTAPAVRIGVVGTTWYAETHLRNLRSHPAVELAAIAGRDQARAEEVASRHGIARVHADYASLLADGGLDAVVIVAPDELHAPIAIGALEAGLHVLCEKPLASSVAEAERMHEAARASGLVHMSFFALRTPMHHRYLRTLLDEGYVGRVASARFELSHGFFRGPEYQWRFDARRGTGALGDLGCYVFDQARWLVGEIEAIQADLRTFVDRPAPDGLPYPPANDAAVGLLRFDGGAQATFAVNVITHHGERNQVNSIAIRGEQGTLELEHSFTGARLRGARADEAALHDIEIPEAAWAGADAATVGQRHAVGDRAFVDAILAGRQVEPDFFDGLRVQETIEAAFTAAASGGWASIPYRRRNP